MSLQRVLEGMIDFSKSYKGNLEVASDTTHPYAVNDKAYAALLDLVTDICKRNGIKKWIIVNKVDKKIRTK